MKILRFLLCTGSMKKSECFIKKETNTLKIYFPINTTTVVHCDLLLLTKFGKDLGFKFLVNLKVQI